MVLDDSRARRSTLKFAREAARKGVSITFTDKTLKDAGKANAKIALECAGLVERIINPKATGWAWMLHVEGDLFIQPVIADGELKGAKRMPAISMERCTDDADELLEQALVDAYREADITWQGKVLNVTGSTLARTTARQEVAGQVAKPVVIEARRFRLPHFIGGRRDEVHS